MFVRLKSTSNKQIKQVQIVESYRKNGEPRQRVLYSCGKAFIGEELDNLIQMAELKKVKMQQEVQTSLLSPEETVRITMESKRRKEETKAKCNPLDLKEEQRVSMGIYEVYGELYQQLGFDKLFSSRRKVAKRNLFHITMARIANPQSKRASVMDLSSKFGVHLNLQSVYRMMDAIDDNFIEKLNKLAYKQAKKIQPDGITCTLYDCTSLYFESFKEDELKRNGYSKDNKFNQPQVLLSLLSTSEGLPIGYELFSGNTYEGHTLDSTINKLKKKYKIQKIIIAGDAGMLNKKNIQKLEDEGIEYVLGAKIKSMTKEIRKKIINTKRYKDAAKNDLLYDKIRRINLAGDKDLIVSYSEKRAKKNRKDREKNVEKLKTKLSKNKNPKEAISNYGYKKYLDLVGKSKIVLNEDKIKEDEQWDGLFGVISNIKDMSNDDILGIYHRLWKIEECFRVTKHDLRVRPIFHWTPQKIKAHIAICFMALVLVKNLSYMVSMRYENMSVERIRRELDSSQATMFRDMKTGRRYSIPSKATEWAEKIYNLVGVKISKQGFKIVD